MIYSGGGGGSKGITTCVYTTHLFFFFFTRVARLKVSYFMHVLDLQIKRTSKREVDN